MFEELLKPCADDDTGEIILKVVLPAIAKVCQHLFSDLLQGGKHANIDEAGRNALAGTPKHNKFSESVFGFMDQLVRSKPNISTLSAEAYVMFANNKTNAWLEEKRDPRANRWKDVWAQVPVETTCHVICSVVKEISATTVDCLPNPTTVSQFAYELGVISDLQVGEVLVKHSNVTLAWDATSLDAQHVNEVHVTVPTVPPTGYVWQVSVLPGGTTDDYSSHIQQAINDVCQTYSLHHHLQTITVPTSSKPSIMYVGRTHCTITYRRLQFPHPASHQ